VPIPGLSQDSTEYVAIMYGELTKLLMVNNVLFTRCHLVTVMQLFSMQIIHKYSSVRKVRTAQYSSVERLSM